MKREDNKGVSPEEKERRRQREERAEKARHKRRRERALARDRNPLGTLEDLPKGARMWEAVFKSAQERGFSEERAAQQAWGAVKAAGYRQDAQGVWQAPRAENPLGPSVSRSRLAPEQKLPSEITGPIALRKNRDGLWITGNGLAVPVEGRDEGKALIQNLSRRRNPTDVTTVRFRSIDDLAEGLAIMDVASRPGRHASPIVFQLDWPKKSLVLQGHPDDRGISHALSSLDRAGIAFEAAAMPYAANPEDGSPGRAAGYAFLGNIIGSVLGFGLGALVGAVAGAVLGGSAGAVLGGTAAGMLGGYGGSIYGAGIGGARGAPKGQERDAKIGGAIGAAIPWVSLFTAPLGAYIGAEE